MARFSRCDGELIGSAVNHPIRVRKIAMVSRSLRAHHCEDGIT